MTTVRHMATSTGSLWARGLPSSMRTASSTARQVPGALSKGNQAKYTQMKYMTTGAPLTPSANKLAGMVSQSFANMKAQQRSFTTKQSNEGLATKVEKSSFRQVPETAEERKFVDSLFDMFDLNANGMIEMWEIRAIYESGCGGVVGAKFIESGLAGDFRNFGLALPESLDVGTYDKTVAFKKSASLGSSSSANSGSYGLIFSDKTVKAMDLIDAVMKKKVALEEGGLLMKPEFTRWAMRIVELHKAGLLESGNENLNEVLVGRMNKKSKKEVIDEEKYLQSLNTARAVDNYARESVVMTGL